MRILLLGANGMLGHQLWLYLGNSFEVIGTTRIADKKLSNYVTQNRTLITGIDVRDTSSLKDIFNTDNFDWIINCVGIIKQRKEILSPISSIYINSLFPHLLAELATSKGCRLLHVSTDCVFSGERGSYTEEDKTDAYDLYGKSKMMGEISYDNHLTLRTSIIGHELYSSDSLLDWFLSSNGVVNGYVKAIYSGLTTLQLSKEIENLLLYHKHLRGIYQISSEPINKCDLLKLVNSIYKKNATIIPFEDFANDKSLKHDKFSRDTSYIPNTWEKMIKEMYSNYLNYKIHLYDDKIVLL